jgi:hypothetical protein
MKRLALTLLFIVFLCPLAHATAIDYGDYVYDSESQLYWLKDWTALYSMDYYEQLAYIESLDGDWHFASSEIGTLWDQSGDIELASMIFPLNNFGTDYHGRLLVDDSSGDYLIDFAVTVVQWFGEGGPTYVQADTFGIPVDNDSKGAEYGAFVCATRVPEPSEAIFLFLSIIIAICVCRPSKGRQHAVDMLDD